MPHKTEADRLAYSRLYESTARTKPRKPRNPVQQRAAHLLCTFGITVEEFDYIRLKQCNKCAICSQDFVDTPHVDHDHDTKWVRGLLCRACNVGLGCFEDSIETVRKALDYLETQVSVEVI